MGRHQNRSHLPLIFSSHGPQHTHANSLGYHTESCCQHPNLRLPPFPNTLGITDLLSPLISPFGSSNPASYCCIGLGPATRQAQHQVTTSLTHTMERWTRSTTPSSPSQNPRRAPARTQYFRRGMLQTHGVSFLLKTCGDSRVFLR